MGLSLLQVALLALLPWLWSKVVWGLYLSPLSKVPGPKLAAVTYLNEFYHQAVRNHWGSYLKSLHERYGPIVRINPNEVHILDHDFNFVHFNKRNLDKEERYFQLAPRSTATITPHSEHKVQRDIILPLFNGKTLRQFEESSLPVYLSKLDVRLNQFAESGRPLNLTHLFWAASNDIMAKYIFGAELGLLDQEDLKAGYHLRSFNATRLASVFRQWPLVLIFKIRDLPIIRYIAALPIEALVRKLTKPLFTTSTVVGGETKSVNGIARVLFDNHQLYRDPSVLNPECEEFMLGGTEALTYNLVHVFHGLMSNPNIIAVARKELNDLMTTKDRHVWDDASVVNLKYLNAVVREGFRLNDSEGIRFVRQSRDTVTYMGFVIPPSTTISMTEMFINWDPVIFPEPGKFKPERWLSSDSEADRARKLSVAFGLGNRTCAAKDLVLSMMTRIVAALLIKYDISFWSEAEEDGWGIGYLKLFPSATAVGPIVAVRPRSV